MNRDFLKGLDLGEGAKLPDAAVEAIMAEHGKAVTPLRDAVDTLTRERDTWKTQAEGAQDWKARYDADTADLRAKADALQKTIDIRDARDKVSAETGVPADLLTGEDEESCKQQAENMLKWRGTKPKYPDTGDGGEVRGNPGGTTRDQFAQWFSAAQKGD